MLSLGEFRIRFLDADAKDMYLFCIVQQAVVDRFLMGFVGFQRKKDGGKSKHGALPYFQANYYLVRLRGPFYERLARFFEIFAWVFLIVLPGMH